MISWSSIEPVYYLLPIAGLLVGLVGTILGGGGGFFFMPLLTLIAKVPVHSAIVISLIATLPIGFIGTWGHYKQGNLDFNHGKWFVLFGTIGAIFGSFTVGYIPSLLLSIGFGLYLILMGINMVIKNNRKKDQTSTGLINKKVNSDYSKISGYGFISGIISGVFGTSGTAPVLAGLFALQLPYQKVVGTSLMVISANAIFAIGTHLNRESLDFTTTIFLTTGTLLGAFTGPVLFRKMGLGKLKKSPAGWYGAVIALLGLIMILKS